MNVCRSIASTYQLLLMMMMNHNTKRIWSYTWEEKGRILVDASCQWWLVVVGLLYRKRSPMIRTMQACCDFLNPVDGTWKMWQLLQSSLPLLAGKKMMIARQHHAYIARPQSWMIYHSEGLTWCSFVSPSCPRRPFDRNGTVSSDRYDEPSLFPYS